MKKNLILPPLLFLLFLLPAEGRAETELPRGELVEKVAAGHDPERAYALYLPSGYGPERACPILYGLDARGRARRGAEPFLAAAERFGWIVASSHDSSSDGPVEPTVQAMRAMWADTHARFSIDERRAYAAGFSGTVRVACSLAAAAPGTLAGIVGAGAGFPPEQPPTRETPFVFYGTVGTEDFNYYEMVRLEEKMASLGLPHHLEVFPGLHDWPPEEIATAALGWMELQAMKAGLREKDPALVEALWKEGFERARAHEVAGDPVAAQRAWAALAAGFTGLRETSPAAARAAELGTSEAVRREVEERRQRLARDEEYLKRAPGVLGATTPEGLPVPLGWILGELRIPELKSRAAAEEDSDERSSARRLLATVGVQAGFYLPRMYGQRGDWNQAIRMLSIAAEIRPEDPGVWYQRAAAHARAGFHKRALADLETALKTGWKDLDRLRADPAFEALREDAAFRRLTAPAPPSPPRTSAPGRSGSTPGRR
jgi:predicted esterase